MSRHINASVFIDYFASTGNPGEYTFTNASYVNVSDATGNAAYDAQAGAILFVAASDINTGAPITGVVHRYKITQLSVVNANTISGTILWDEDGEELDTPTNGSFCLYSQPTQNHSYSLPPSDIVYSELPVGSSLAALNLDIKNISDKLSLSEQLTASAETVNNIPTLMTIGTLQFVPLVQDVSYIFDVKVIGKSIDKTKEASITFSGSARKTNVGSEILGGVLKNRLHSTDSSWDVTIDTSAGGLTITVIGDSSLAVNWSANISLSKSI